MVGDWFSLIVKGNIVELVPEFRRSISGVCAEAEQEEDKD